MNWDGYIAPTNGDTVVFDNNAVNDCHFNLNLPLSPFQLNTNFGYYLYLIGVSSTCEASTVTMGAGKRIVVYDTVTFKINNDVSGLSGTGTGANEKTYLDLYGSSGSFTLQIPAGSTTGTVEYLQIDDPNACSIVSARTIDFSTCVLNIKDATLTGTTSFTGCTVEMEDLSFTKPVTITSCPTFKLSTIQPTAAASNLTITNTDIDMYGSTYWYFTNFDPDHAFTITRTNSKFLNFEPSIHYRTTGTGAFSSRLGLPEQLTALKKNSKSTILKHDIIGSPLPYIDVISGDEQVEFGYILSPNSLSRIAGAMRVIEERFDVIGFSWYDGMIKKGVFENEPVRTYDIADKREFQGVIGATL